jgi:phenylalanyl-tRNA synthetase beta chain
MKFSIKWLQKLVDLKTTPEALAAQLTDIGLEVEGIVGDVLDVSVPPNRADCLGVVGIAREAATVNNINFTPPVIDAVATKINDQVKIEVLDTKACPKYIGRIIRNIDNSKPTPQWMQECLTNAGIKLISPVVDITNYVLLEWGQPLHAYDLTKIEGGIIVRRAKKGESLALLDDSTIEVKPETLVIADHKKPVALAGIMGGKDSGITPNTTDILFESALFDAVEIRLTSRQYGIQSDSSYRYERCIDASMREGALERATQLVLELVGGQVGPAVKVEDLKQLPKPVLVTLRFARVARVLGISVLPEKIEQILRQLGMHTKPGINANEIVVTVPTFRTDITGEIDLIEEIVRIYGFQNIPAQLPIGTLTFASQAEHLISEERILNCLINRGYNEAITYSFIDTQLAKSFGFDLNNTVSITNPISENMSLMRPSLLPGLVTTLQHNQNRQQARVRLFESGLRFVGNNKTLQQIKTIAGVCAGNNFAENWASPARGVDFYDLKADVRALFKLSLKADSLEFKECKDPAFHPGKSVTIAINGTAVGNLGALHPALQQSLGLSTAVEMFEIDFSAIENGKVASFAAFSKYPAVRRDLALLLDAKLSAAKLESTIRKKVGGLLSELVIFDVYQGKGIPEGKKSMALGITLQDANRTLVDTEVNDLFANVIAALEKEFGATLR